MNLKHKYRQGHCGDDVSSQLVSVSILVRTMPAALENKTVVYSNDILGNQATLLHVDVEEISRTLPSVVLSILGLFCVQITEEECIGAIDFYSSCFGGRKDSEATVLCEAVNVTKSGEDIIYSGVVAGKVSVLL